MVSRRSLQREAVLPLGSVVKWSIRTTTMARKLLLTPSSASMVRAMWQVAQSGGELMVGFTQTRHRLLSVRRIWAHTSPSLSLRGNQEAQERALQTLCL